MKLIAPIPTAEQRLRLAVSLLEEVHPSSMGGTPDLFGPSCGWDDWEERAADFLNRESVIASYLTMKG